VKLISVFFANVQDLSSPDISPFLLDLYESQILIENLGAGNLNFQFQKQFLAFLCELFSSFNRLSSVTLGGSSRFDKLQGQVELIALQSFGIDEQSRLVLSFYSFCCSVVSFVLGKASNIAGLKFPQPSSFGLLSAYENEIWAKAKLVHDSATVLSYLFRRTFSYHLYLNIQL
jgi:hypothetical protein